MASITFTIPNQAVNELQQIAQRAGFPGAKAMVIAYLIATIKGDRDRKIREAITEATIDDVIIS